MNTSVPMRLEVVCMVGLWAGGQGAYTQQVGEQQARQEAPMGDCES